MGHRLQYREKVAIHLWRWQDILQMGFQMEISWASGYGSWKSSSKTGKKDQIL